MTALALAETRLLAPTGLDADALFWSNARTAYGIH